MAEKLFYEANIGSFMTYDTIAWMDKWALGLLCSNKGSLEISKIIKYVIVA